MSTRPAPLAPEPSAGSSRFLIRTARPKELAGIAHVLTDSFHSSNGLCRWMHPLFRLGIYEDLRARLRASGSYYICLVAIALPTSESSQEVSSPAVGVVEMSLRPHSSWTTSCSQYLYLSNLAVSPPYRRQGVASQLLLACEEYAANWGFSELYLHVLENNREGRRLYFKAGYRLHRAEPILMLGLFPKPKRLLLRKCLN
ncbi:MAG: GNAT family N-acetyltransferase [Oscillatoria sp. SIO1A7]|nr:GNAT family N-acetyltransferase [Oscillatoria sp. SIO1A7]